MGINRAANKKKQGAIKSNVKKVEYPVQSVYKRKIEYPLKTTSYTGPKDRFVTCKDSCFDEVINASYQGLSILEGNAFPNKFHSDFQSALTGLELDGAYQFDVTQPAGLGTKLAKTYVTRCLVGEAGTTYKYLGLRMFSFPWNAGEIGATEHMIKLNELNKSLIYKTHGLLKQLNRETVGSCEYNLTLINRFVCMVSNMYNLITEHLGASQ